ncbi:MAG: tRNA threonylcarbamoyladenosine dehydratase [Hydrogenophaga sp.]|uniref:tRNA threonylcarbamoyladenosine dehydratase n=1 Tax=Hydrogenophaga sp. TaxID=1904254 RepID=UPI001D761C67|nr:tRNA threonylcarbamoyladenosine dehydratase [Hydrogenophaga sp.]MBX3610201.1 tRNA threonylcarbamoyladenosine dehydratase [Hydrogenophaga sp.]
MTALDADRFERRFGGLRRLYGVDGAQRIFDAHVVVVGIGGVGSWAAEALARSGVKRLTLIDLDHIAESNVNRQVHAIDMTLGQAKVDAMRDRILGIHPDIELEAIDDFVDHDNWPGLLGGQTPDAVIDACDAVRAKAAMAAWAIHSNTHFVTVGAAGGKRRAQEVQIADLGDVTHDPLLAQLRYRLRKHHAAPRQGRMGVSCVFSKEAVAPPDPSCAIHAGGDGSLNCHGYGSVVSVTATFGLCAAGWVLDAVASQGLRKKLHRPSEVDKNHAII